MDSTRRSRLVSIAMVALGLVLALFVAITLPAWRRGVLAGAAARDADTRAALEGLADALDAYRAEQGAYPPTGDGVTTLVIHLDGRPENGGPDTAYYAFEDRDLVGLHYLDSARRPFRYRRTDGGFVVWSSAGKRDPEQVSVEVERSAP